MSRFRQTLEQALAATRSGSPEFIQWPEHSVPGILRLIWQAYDRLSSFALKAVDINLADLQVERSVSALLSDEIQAILIERGGFASYVVGHERWEMETLDYEKSNRPSQYDICFVWLAQRELKWPCEAKVLNHESDVTAYVKDITVEFIPCVYGPLSGSGAMLGLLLKGDAQLCLKSIGEKLQEYVVNHPDFPDRAHGTTELLRTPPNGKLYAKDFTLHHMILHLRPT